MNLLPTALPKNVSFKIVYRLPSMDTENIELATLSANAAGRSHDLIEQNFEPVEESDRPLPRADGGKDAWLFLTACFIVEALVCV
jgi:hypothetical protein